MKLEGRFDLLSSKVISPETKNPSDLLIYTMTRGPDRFDDPTDNQDCLFPPHCGNVRPLEALKASFSANKELTRQSADFVAVIISNRDEEEDTSAEDVIREFKKVHGSGKKLSVLSLIILPGDEECHIENEKRTFFLFHHWQKNQPRLQNCRTGQANRRRKLQYLHEGLLCCPG